ncbi:TetR/AcrR family transcriptional regulator [Natronospora cellulosivora (SeqCode)]
MGTNERKEREKAERKNSIINAAKKLFLLNGFDNTTLMEIAKKSELAKGTLYLYFENKEDIYFAVIYRETSKIVNKIEEISEQEMKGIDKLEEISRYIYEYYKKDPDILEAIWYADYIGTKENITPYQNLTSQEDAKIFKLISNILQTGIEDGSIKKDVNPIKTAIVITKIMMNMIGLLLDDQYEHTPLHKEMTVEEIYYSTFELIKNSLT